MKNSALSLLTCFAIALTGCSTVSWKATPKQDVAWVNLRMKIPATWEVTTKEDGLDAENSVTHESVAITALEPSPTFLATNPSPLQIIEKAIENLSPPDPEAPETYTMVPYRIFYLPCGEPAAVVVQGLGGNEFTVSFSVASAKSMYSVNFYRTGTPVHMLDYYQDIIETASIRGYPGSKCAE